MSKLTPDELKARMDLVGTPCIGVCSTAIGDSICKGCGRTSDEVIRWNTMNDEERREIADKLMVEAIQRQIQEHKEQRSGKDIDNDEDAV